MFYKALKFWVLINDYKSDIFENRNSTFKKYHKSGIFETPYILNDSKSLIFDKLYLFVLPKIIL